MPEPLNLADFLIDQQHPTVKERDWMKDKKFVLVRPDILDECIDSCIQSGRYAIDLETTGLDNRVANGRTVDHIAGVCLSPDGVRGYYIPLGHVKVDRAGNRTPRDCNVPRSVFDKAIRRLIKATEDGLTVAIFHHGKFDQEFLQFNGAEPWGEWDKPMIWDDTVLLAYLGNSRKRDKQLKSLSRELLGIEQVELKELYPEGHKGPIDFSVLDPEDQSVLWYGGGDAICTWLLYPVLAPAVLEPASDGVNQKLIYNIEKTCVAATRWMERNRIHIDRKKVLDLIHLGQQEWYDSIMEVYQEADRLLGRDVMPGYYKALQTFFVADDPKIFIPRMLDRAKEMAKAKYPDPQGKIKGRADKEWPPIYDVNAPKQLGTMFDEMGVPNLKRTEKSNQVKTSKDELKRVIDQTGDKFPFMDKIRRFRETHKALTSYLYPMYLDCDRSNDTMRVNFRGDKVDTGRFSTPSKNAARGRLEGWPQVNFQSIPATYDPSRPACMTRLRECITARPTPEGHPPKYVVACVEEGALVPTKHGLVPIEQIQSNDQVRTETGWADASRVIEKGHRHVLRITTSKGFSLRVTPEHLVRSVGSDGLVWKPAQALQSGDWVVQVYPDRLSVEETFREPVVLPPTPELRPWERPIKTPNVLTVEIAELLGRFMGDGWIGHSKGIPRYVGISLGNDVDELLPFLNVVADRLFGVLFTEKGKGDVVKWSNPLTRWWLELSGKKSTSDMWMPSVIWAASVREQAAFIRGLFDADGSVGSRSGDGLSIWITSSRFAQDTQLLLLELGVQATRRWEQRETNYGHCSGWLLTITGKRNLKQFGLAGFVTKRKQQAYQALLEAGYNRDMTEVFPLELAQLAVPRQRHPNTNRVHTNGRRKGRVSRQLLSVACQHPDDIDPIWMNRLLGQPYFYDTVETVVPDGEARVFDITVPKERHFMANGLIVHNCDFSGVELRIVTNLSREPKWLAEFFHCANCDRTFDRGDGQTTPEPPPPRCPNCGSDKIGDLHTLTALEIYGQDAISRDNWKALRGFAKSSNFALCYGGGGLAVTRAAKVDKHEGWRIKNQFDRAYTGLKHWWGTQHTFARLHLMVRTSFARMYPVPDIKHDNGGFRSKAERNSINGPIQGTSADITKIAMVLVYKECKRRNWLDKCAMIITMHDELVFEIDGDILEEAIAVIVPIMTRNPFIMAMKWPIPLTCDVEIGPDWTVPWDLNEMRHGEIRFIGNTKYTEKMRDKGKMPADAVWEHMNQWPAELMPWFPDTSGADADPPDKNPPSGSGGSNSSGPPEPPSDGGATGIMSVATSPAVGAPPGGDFSYRLRVPPTIGLVRLLAETIVTCRGRGTRNLRLFTRQGEELTGWKDKLGVESLYVHPMEFTILAREHGI